MIQASAQMRILVAVEPVDFRCGIDGLVRICRDHLKEDPFSGALYVFRNRRATSIKVVTYDSQGFWLCQKRLSSGHFRFWPASATGTSRRLEAHELQVLIAQGRPIACLAWSSAPRHLGPRDHFIGWSAEARRKNIRFLAYNTRFLLLPFIGVAHAASHILGYMSRLLSEEWERAYGHPLYYLETFVDPARFRGTCYRAANWICLGLTTGRGKDDHTNRPNRPVKEVLGLPLRKDFRRLLGELL